MVFIELSEDSPIFITLMKISIELRAIAICIENVKRPLNDYKYHSDDNVMPRELYVNNIINTAHENISYIDEKNVSFYADEIDKIISPDGWDNETYANLQDDQEFMEDETISSLGHLTMNPENDPFLGPQA